MLTNLTRAEKWVFWISLTIFASATLVAWFAPGTIDVLMTPILLDRPEPSQFP